MSFQDKEIFLDRLSRKVGTVDSLYARYGLPRISPGAMKIYSVLADILADFLACSSVFQCDVYGDNAGLTIVVGIRGGARKLYFEIPVDGPIVIRKVDEKMQTIEERIEAVERKSVVALLCWVTCP